MKELVALSLYAVLTIAAIVGVVFLWRVSNRVVRPLSIVGTAALHFALSMLIVEWASSGGCMSGFGVALIVVPSAWILGSFFLVCAIVSLFSGPAAREMETSNASRSDDE